MEHKTIKMAYTTTEGFLIKLILNHDFTWYMDVVF